MKRCQAAIVAALLMMGCLQPVVAQGENIPYSLSVTPFAGGYVFEGNQQRKNSEIYGLAVGYNLSEHWGLELTGTYSPDIFSTAVPRQQTVNLYEVRGDVLYHFMPQKRFVPYVAAGGGIIFFDPRQGEVDHDTLADYGAGFKLFLTDYLALRGDVRHILDFTVRDVNRTRYVYNNFAYTAGLTFQLGGTKQAVAPVPHQTEWKYTEPPSQVAMTTPVTVAHPAAPMAETVAPVPVPVATKQRERSKTGMPVITSIMAAGNSIAIKTSAPVDSYKTMALEKPARLAIDIFGATNGMKYDRIAINRMGVKEVRVGTDPGKVRIVIDAAGDRLPEYRLQRSATGLELVLPGQSGFPVGASVPSRAGEEVAVELNVEFTTGSARIRPAFYPQLQQLADFMRANPRTSIIIEGHTDNIGPDWVNKKLSLQRAQSIRSFLIKTGGIAPKRIVARSFASFKPVGDNETTEGRQLNRRAVAVITAMPVR